MSSRWDRRSFLLASVTGVMSMNTFSQTAVWVTLPTLRHDLHLSAVGVQWVVNAYGLPLAMLVALGGRLGDRFGRTKMLVAGVVVFAVAAAVAGLAVQETTLLIARAIQGAGAALMLPAAASIVVDSFQGHELGRATAIALAVSSGFIALGPVVGGALTELISWRVVFVLNLAIAAGVLAFTVAARPANQARPERGLDLTGALLLVGALGALVISFQEGAVWGWSSVATLALLATGAVLLVVLVVLEHRAAEPLLDLAQFRNPHYGVDSLVVAALRFGTLGVAVYSTIYFQDTLGFSPLQSGFAIAPFVVALIVGTRLSGRVFDRLGARTPVGAGTAMLAAGLGLTAPLLAHDSYVLILPGLLIIGFGMGLANMAVTDALNHVPTERRGQASGMIQTVRHLGGSLGVAIAGALYADTGLAATYLLAACAMALASLSVLIWLPPPSAVRAQGSPPLEAESHL